MYVLAIVNSGLQNTAMHVCGLAWESCITHAHKLSQMANGQVIVIRDDYDCRRSRLCEHAD